MISKTISLLAVAGLMGCAQADLNFNNQCPNGWSSNQIGDSTVYCCPGAGHIMNNQGSCCIGFGTVDGTCATTVPFDTPGYTSIVSSLAASYSSSHSMDLGGGIFTQNGGGSPVSLSTVEVTQTVAGNTFTMAVPTAVQASSSGSTSSSAGGAVPTSIPYVVKVLVGVAGGAAMLV